MDEYGSRWVTGLGHLWVGFHERSDPQDWEVRSLNLWVRSLKSWFATSWEERFGSQSWGLDYLWKRHMVVVVVGWGTKRVFFVPLFYQFFFQNYGWLLGEYHRCHWLVTWWISCSYLTGVTTAKLWWHLPNMIVTWRIWEMLFANSEISLTEELMNKALLTSHFWSGMIWLWSLTQWGRDIFKCIFFNENVWISIQISLKFVPKGPINNIPHWVRLWLDAGRATSHYLNKWWLVYWHICITWPQWVIIWSGTILHKNTLLFWIMSFDQLKMFQSHQ